MKECKNCEVEHYESSEFCSKKCARSYATKFDIKHETKDIFCKKCNTVHKINKRASDKNFVCKDCLFIEKTCENCYIKFKIHPKKIGRFCSANCTRIFNTTKTNMSVLGAFASVQKRVIRSRDEIKLYALIEENFNFKLRNNVPVLVDYPWDADIIIDDLKIVILWNGPWHYKELGIKNHSLKQVQTRDKIKTELFENNGWMVLVYQDNEYTPETALEDLKKIISGCG